MLMISDKAKHLPGTLSLLFSKINTCKLQQ